MDGCGRGAYVLHTAPTCLCLHNRLPRDHNASASGKIETLVRLLRRLKVKGHRVVIFSQFTRFMDIVDDFLNMAGYSFVRLDGSTNRVQRMVVSGLFEKKLGFPPLLLRILLMLPPSRLHCLSCSPVFLACRYVCSFGWDTFQTLVLCDLCMHCSPEHPSIQQTKFSALYFPDEHAGGRAGSESLVRRHGNFDGLRLEPPSRPASHGSCAPHRPKKCCTRLPFC